jgi:hypothetical protein
VAVIIVSFAGWTRAGLRIELTTLQTLASLQPVTFNYKTDTAWQHVGFIAEDVPELVASPDRKGLSPMDIVAVLTKVVQEQRQQLGLQQQRLQAEASRGDALEKRLLELASEVRQLKAGTP